MSAALDPRLAAGSGETRPSFRLGARADEPGRSPSALERGLIEDGPFERCLEPLLLAAGWRGDPRQIIEALPHLEKLQSVNDLRLVLHRLGFRSTVDLLRVEEIIDERLPAIWAEDGAPLVLLATRAEGRFLVYDPDIGAEREFEPPRRRMQLCRVHSLLDGERDDAQDGDRTWLGAGVQRMGGAIAYAAALTLGANLLALTAPLFTMVVYNAILPSEGVDTLVYLVSLVFAALALETILRRARASVLSNAAARLNCAVLTKSFARILLLPSAMVQNASVAAQTARVKQFESIVGAFSGPVLGALFDLPFTLVFLFAIAVLGGPLAFAPIGAIALFVILGLLIAPASESAARRAAILKERVGALTHEMLSNLESIHDIGAAAIWRQRVGEAHRRAVSARLKAAFLDYLRSSASLFFIALSMLATICLGALMVIDGALTVGALVAISMLGARVLGPVQTLFMATQPLRSSRDAARRFEALLRIKTDPMAETAPAAFRAFKGGIQFREVAFRFPNADDFALRGLSAEIQPGEIVGLIGPGGSGKSTVLKLLLGLHRPLSGQILIDAANMAQIHQSELRGVIAYAPPEPDFFYGTIAQNMRLGRPTATLEEIEAVLEELGVVLTEDRFPDGLQTRLSAQDFSRLSASLRQRLSLTRTLVKNAPITLLDEPTAMLAPDDEALLWRALARRRGGSTVLVSLSDRAQLMNCDRVMALAGGRLARFDTPQALLQPAKG